MDNLMNSEAAAGKTVVVGEEDGQLLKALSLISGQAFPLVLKSASELNLFDIIAAAGDETWLSASDIANQVPTKNPDAPAMLDGMLGYLACVDVFKCKVQDAEEGSEVYRLYGASPVTKLFAEKEGQVSLGPLLGLMHSKAWTETWSGAYCWGYV